MGGHLAAGRTVCRIAVSKGAPSVAFGIDNNAARFQVTHLAASTKCKQQQQNAPEAILPLSMEQSTGQLL